MEVGRSGYARSAGCNGSVFYKMGIKSGENKSEYGSETERFSDHVLFWERSESDTSLNRV